MTAPALLARGRAFLALPLASAAALLAAVLALTGAFGSFVIVMPLRFAYWLLTLLSSGAALFWSRKLLGRWLTRDIALSCTTIASAAVATAIAAAVIAYAAGLRTGPGLPAFAVIGASVTPPLYVLWRMLERSGVAAASTEQKREGAIPARLAGKLPPRLGRSRLIALEAQDHYLRVITYDGEALVHLRLSDALQALEQTDGLQVHRSWWVAASAVDELRIARGRGEIIAANNLRVPVSRSFAEGVRARFNQVG